MVRDISFRRSVAASARHVRAGSLSFLDFVKQIGSYETGDELVDELIDLLEHEPAEGGWFGVGRQVHSEYVAEIDRIIEQLDSESA